MLQTKELNTNTFIGYNPDKIMEMELKRNKMGIEMGIEMGIKTRKKVRQCHLGIRKKII